jgi:DNA-binding transcriptional LysR family regulator
MKSMENVDLFKTDFQSLRLLVTVHRLQSFTAAADALALNQSTVSYTVNRLRAVFRDPLFVRMGKGIAATRRCDEIVRGADDLIRRFADLATPTGFDPATTTERVVLSCNFYEREVILPALVRLIRHEAPGLRLSVIQSNTRGHEQLRDNECDLLLSPLVTDSLGLYTRALFEEHYAVFTSTGSIWAQRALTLPDYAGAGHLLLSYEGNWRPFYHETLADLGITLDPVLDVPGIGAVPQLMAGTDLLLTAPSRLADALRPGCVMLKPPFHSNFRLQMFWNATAHERPVNRWLRRMVSEALRSAGTGDGSRGQSGG